MHSAACKGPTDLIRQARCVPAPRAPVGVRHPSAALAGISEKPLPQPGDGARGEVEIDGRRTLRERLRSPSGTHKRKRSYGATAVRRWGPSVMGPI